MPPVMVSAAFDVVCPHCRALLTISPEARAVAGHKEPLAPKPVADMDEAVERMKKDPDRRESLFAQSVESEKNKADRLKKSFEDLLRRTGDSPDSARPVRDMDLD
ncbi:MAG: hypothetical protein KBG07_03270 [Elusimicrobia bacterium]|nr:hypothetical protein [Elusimicrobiota bacterium]MBP9127770.1 hypothetical protein [Elusimicrobiota bacterium]